MTKAIESDLAFRAMFDEGHSMTSAERTLLRDAAQYDGANDKAFGNKFAWSHSPTRARLILIGCDVRFLNECATAYYMGYDNE